MKDELFKNAIAENYQKLTRICYRYFGNIDDAHDAVQDILLKVWINKTKFRGDSSITTWMFRIATNVCLTTIQKNKREIRVDDFAVLPEYALQSDEDVTDHEDSETKLKFLQDFLNRLTPTDRIMVNLYIENIDSCEIALVTGLSEVNVRTRIYRIKKQIKKEWEDTNGHR